MTNEAFLDQQDVKNMEAAQTMEEQLDKATKEAEDAHTAYFEKRKEQCWDRETEIMLWEKYQKAHRAEQDFLWAKMDAKRYEQDPNDYQEDDKVPADPQERELEVSYHN